jgi:hypothetical protein
MTVTDVTPIRTRRRNRTRASAAARQPDLYGKRAAANRAARAVAVVTAEDES